MLNVPENLSGAVNRQTVLTINTKKVMEPLSSHSIGSINNMSCRNSPPYPLCASYSFIFCQSHRFVCWFIFCQNYSSICRQNCPNLKKILLERDRRFLSKPMPGLQESGHIWDGTSLILNVMWMYPLFFWIIQARLSAIPGLSSTVRKQARMEVLLLGQVRKRIMRSYLWTLTDWILLYPESFLSLL